MEEELPCRCEARRSGPWQSHSEAGNSKGIIHRDLKPGNVWLTAPLAVGAYSNTPLPEGRAEPVAKIGDFGLAVAIDRSRLTMAGMMVGTQH